MQIGCLARYFNPYEAEVEFARNNNFQFMQIWYDRNVNINFLLLFMLF